MREYREINTCIPSTRTVPFLRYLLFSLSGALPALTLLLSPTESDVPPSLEKLVFRSLPQTVTENARGLLTQRDLEY